MDDKDRTLLTLLRRDGRRPVVALARDLGLSRSATQDRLAKLQASGAIGGFTLVEERSTDNRESAYLTVRFAPEMKCAQIVPKLKKIHAISTIYSVSGSIDLFVRIEAEDVAGLEAARAAIAEVPGIVTAKTYVVLERHLGSAPNRWRRNERLASVSSRFAAASAIARCRPGEAAGHSPISSSVRPQPIHSRPLASSLQILMQGEGSAVSAGAF